MHQPSTDGQTIKVVGFDPSLRNWGIAVGTYELANKKLSIEKLSLICPNLPTGKQIRQNSLDLESAHQLYKDATAVVEGAHAVFVEVPVGSQSARAMAGYAICVGVLGSMKANGIHFFELTPDEIKLAGFGKKTATKKQMISWAVSKHPEANWPTYKHKGEQLITESIAEHQADAVAAIYAGISCTPFQQLLSIRQ